MKERNRNLAVGVTVLVALLMLAVMIFLFTGLPQIFQPGYDIRVRVPTSGGVAEGDYVFMRGIRVGRVTRVSLSDPAHPADGVTLRARIQPDVRLPSNVVCRMHRGLMGSVHMELMPEGPLRTDPRTGKTLEHLPTDETSEIPGEVLPSAIEALRPAMEEISAFAGALGELIEGDPTQGAGPGTAPASQPANLKGAIVRLNGVLDSIDGVIRENRSTLKVTVENLAQAADQATEAMQAVKDFADDAREMVTQAGQTIDQAGGMIDETREKVIKLTETLIRDAEDVSRLLTTANRIAARIEQGDGTAGRLINDPDLYHNLVEASRKLGDVMSEIELLTRELRTKGFKIR